MSLRKKWLIIGYKLALKDIRYFADRFGDTAHQDFMRSRPAFSPPMSKPPEYYHGQADAYSDVQEHAEKLEDRHSVYEWEGLVNRAKKGEADD